MKNELNSSHNGGGDAYLLQSVAIHFKHTVLHKTAKNSIRERLEFENVYVQELLHV